ncbi:hypothetical protein IPC691_09975 [Pseudomonas aeruginosa]|nr:hypothetical protein AO878_01320 [Pseudomonas aeruginosa]RPY26199.1 hypothetical protein IPC690_05690 [Pseudomonas aeruginosa]RPY33909.1 hypothetical protein IPC691_09975 [Pseudomonas aeruginosa]
MKINCQVRETEFESLILLLSESGLLIQNQLGYQRQHISCGVLIKHIQYLWPAEPRGPRVLVQLPAKTSCISCYDIEDRRRIGGCGIQSQCFDQLGRGSSVDPGENSLRPFVGLYDVSPAALSFR